MKRLAIHFTSIAVLLIFFANQICFAGENSYSPTSVLNCGWSEGETAGTEIAHVTFGDKPEMSGMRAEIGDDPSDVTVKNYFGRQGWVITPNKGTSARYINIDIDDKIANSVTGGQSYAVSVEYYDEGRSSLTVLYDSMDYQSLTQKGVAEMTSSTPVNNKPVVGEREYLIFNNTCVWRDYQWFLPNPRFSNQLDGFDFRIGIYSDSMGYSRGGEVTIASIRLFRLDTKSRFSVGNDTEKHIGNIFFQGEDIELSV